MMAAPATVIEAPELEAKALTWPERARALKVESDEDFHEAGNLLVGIKGLRKEIEDHHRPVIAAAFAAHKAATAAKKKLDDPLDEAERTIKRSMSAYHDAQERRRREEQARLEAEARRQEEERRLAEAQALEAEGRHGEAKAVIEEPIIAPVAPAPPPVPKVAGVSMRETWSAEVTDLAALVRAVADGKAPAGLVQANQSALDQLARALKATMAVPGVTVRRQTGVAAGSR
jgi:colicin import membrane protein